MPMDKTVLEKLLSSDTKLELLNLFQSNPKLTYRLDEIAQRIGRNIGEIEHDLDELAEIGLIKRTPNPGTFSLDGQRFREIQESVSKRLQNHKE